MLHTFEDKQRMLRDYDSGMTLKMICRRHSVGESHLVRLIKRYKAYGVDGLRRIKKPRPSASIKLAVVSEYAAKALSLPQISLKYRLGESTVRKWVRLWEQGGEALLLQEKCRGRPPKDDMGRPRKKTLDEMTELERLRYENAYLKAENALLKKVKALVEEREARARATGRRPSRD